jgi:hypothetical protein
MVERAGSPFMGVDGMAEREIKSSKPESIFYATFNTWLRFIAPFAYL